MKRKLINGKGFMAIAFFVACSLLVGCEKDKTDALTDETVGVETTPDGSSVSHQKATGGSCPSWTCPTGKDKNGNNITIPCGCYIQPGLGANKEAYYNSGVNQKFSAAQIDNFLAGAMMETNTMDAKSYVYGDKYPNDYSTWYYTDNGGRPTNKNGNKVWKAGAQKQFDAANFGACKQNWFMMRQSCSRYPNQTENQWNNANELNLNKNIDIKAYTDSRRHWTEDQFLAGHRNAQTGLDEAVKYNRYSQDIKNFIIGYKWVRSQIQRSASYRKNDVRFYVEIPAI